MSSAGRNDRGFTLVELLVVLAILGLSLALVAAAVGRPAGAGLDTDGRALLAALRLAREEAVLTGRDVDFRLDAAARRWDIPGVAAAALSPGVAATVTVDGRLAGGPVAGIRFHPDGGSSGGLIVLDAGTRRRVLTIDWLTGRAALRS